MACRDWTSQVPGPQGGLQEVRSAARDLSQQASHAPGNSGPVFQNVAQIALLGTALVSGALGLIHLYQALTRKPHAPHSRGAAQDGEAERSSRQR